MCQIKVRGLVAASSQSPQGCGKPGTIGAHVQVMLDNELRDVIGHVFLLAWSSLQEILASLETLLPETLIILQFSAKSKGSTWHLSRICAGHNKQSSEEKLKLKSNAVLAPLVQ